MQDFKLLNCDDHGQFLKRHGKDPAEYRPDIAHQVSTQFGLSAEAAAACMHQSQQHHESVAYATKLTATAATTYIEI